VLAGAAFVQRFPLGRFSRFFMMPLLGLMALSVVLLAGCAATYQPMGAAVHTPRLTEQALRAADDAVLPLRAWLPAGPPRAAIVALHGMNDYSNAFSLPGSYWAQQGIATYAYDQRGFGLASRPGIWPDTPTLVADLKAAVQAVHARHPDVPLYVLGESMGGAVAIAALAQPGPGGQSWRREIDGVILSAPALWGRQTMNLFYRLTLWTAYQVAPGMTLTPPRGLKIVPSDNQPMLRALGRDPLVLKRTRVDAVRGLVDLMSVAYDDLERLPRDLPLLVLYGQHEQVLSRKSVAEALARLDAATPAIPMRQAVYERGYHMLLRDRCAATVWRDVAAWVRAPDAPLPSGADHIVWREHEEASPVCADGAPEGTARRDTDDPGPPAPAWSQGG